MVVSIKGERERRLTGGGKRGYKRRPGIVEWMLLPCNANFWGIRHAFGVIDTDSVPLPSIYPVIILSPGCVAGMLFFPSCHGSCQ